MEKKLLLINDFVVRPDKCNFMCKYCLANEFKQDNMGHLQEELIYDGNSALSSRIDMVINKFNNFFDAPILRISGGELFLIKGIEDFLHQQNRYETIQIITNGSLLNETLLNKLKRIHNCILHISLDGVLFSQNSNRISDNKQHRNILSNLNNALKLGLKIEIGSVLTKNNTKDFVVFLDYLKSLEGNICVYPFPIRGKNRNTFYPSMEDVNLFSNILEKYYLYEDILPPKSFFEEVIYTLKFKRALRCHIPKIMLQLFDNGDILPCPNVWTNSVGNILVDTYDTIIANLEDDKMYKLFLQNNPRIPCCHSCITSLDIVNLYYENKIAYDEIVKIPLYSGEKTKKLLKSKHLERLP